MRHSMLVRVGFLGDHMSRPGKPLGPVIRASDRQYLGTFLLVGFFMAVFSAIFASDIGSISALWNILLLWPLFAGALVLVVWTSRAVERLLRFRLGCLPLLLTLGVFGLATFVLAELHNDDQRCINQQSMTVVAAADCQNAGGSQGGTGQDVWYYGGSGTGIGSSVQGGSLNPPADNGNDGGSGGGDTGDDGGDDGGGGEGGGGDG
jgi:hypothetical protein